MIAKKISEKRDRGQPLTFANGAQANMEVQSFLFWVLR